MAGNKRIKVVLDVELNEDFLYDLQRSLQARAAGAQGQDKRDLEAQWQAAVDGKPLAEDVADFIAFRAGFQSVTSTDAGAEVSSYESAGGLAEMLDRKTDERAKRF